MDFFLFDRRVAALAILFMVAVLPTLNGCSPPEPVVRPARPNTTAGSATPVAKGTKTQPAIPTPTTSDPAPVANATPPSKAASNANVTPLIPRQKFFGNPEKARARLSPDGKLLSYAAPVNGVLNVWVGPANDPKAAKAVTHDTERGIVDYQWAYTSQHLLYTQDKNGDEDNHVYSVNLENGEIKDLTPIEKIAAEIEGVSEKFPTEILVGINDRDEHAYHDIYRVNIVTGERKMIQKNPGVAGYMTDDDYRVRFALDITEDGGQVYSTPPEKEGGEWKEFLKIGALDAMTTHAAGFDKTGDKLYLIDSRGRNTACLKIFDLKTGKEELLAENDKADISGALSHPTEKNIQAVSFTHARTEWKILDDAIKPDFEYLKTVADGEIQITGRTEDDKRWTVAYLMDNGPVRFYIYDRAPERKATFLFTSNRELETLPLVKMHPVSIKSRDGLELVSYLTLPKESDPDGNGRPREPLPLVLNVHGGPWARDDWAYDPEHQLLANRGYAVLAVNYRGSTGFGKEFINVANKQWAGTMHDDLIDAVNWAIEQKIAVKDKIAIMGGSYGGYATLVGLTFTPDIFACGVDIVGPSSLITLMQNPPPYWMPFMPVMKLRVGEHETEEGKKFLESRSPLSFVDKIKRPLLIGQGANDPRVKQAEADQIVAAMNTKKIPVTYMLFQDEGHGFARPENRFAFYAVTEAFLAKHLGGRYEPIGDAFSKSKFTVPSGEEGAPGFPEALKANIDK